MQNINRTFSRKQKRLGIKLKRIENKIDKPFSKGYTGDVEKFT